MWEEDVSQETRARLLRWSHLDDSSDCPSGMDPVLYVTTSWQMPVVWHPNILKTQWVANSRSDVSLGLNSVPKVNTSSCAGYTSCIQRLHRGKVWRDNYTQCISTHITRRSHVEKGIRVSLWGTFLPTGQGSQSLCHSGSCLCPKAELLYGWGDTDEEGSIQTAV